MNIMTIESLRVNTLSSILMYYYKLTLSSPPRATFLIFEGSNWWQHCETPANRQVHGWSRKIVGRGGEILGVEQGQWDNPD